MYLSIGILIVLQIHSMRMYIKYLLIRRYREMETFHKPRPVN